MHKLNALLLCWIISVGVHAQSGIRIVEGKLFDAKTQEAIPFATIGILGSPLGTSSNAEGFFSIKVPADFNNATLKIRISSIGYDNVTLENPLGFQAVALKSSTTMLRETIVFGNNLTPAAIVKKAFSRTKKNYNTKPFLYKNFYRHYCKEDSVYGRLIEAATEVYKRKGYKLQQPTPGYKDEVRVTQLRRSLDKTKVSSTHLPIALYQILGTDFVSFQVKKTSYFYFFLPSDVSILKAYSKQTEFKLEGITEFDGQQVYEIHYRIKFKDSVSVKIPPSRYTGKIFINTKDYAFVKVETLRESRNDTTTAIALYKKYKNKYYLYHSIKEATQIMSTDGKTTFPHWSHIESITTEIQTEKFKKFAGKNPTRETLVNISYDSIFWEDYNILKSTPLEEKIVADLSSGKELRQQFAYADSAERAKIFAEKQDEEKFNLTLKELKGTPVYINFWASWAGPSTAEMPASEALAEKYKGKVAFMYLSLDADGSAWRKAMTSLGLRDSVMRYHFRIGTMSDARILFEIKNVPRYVLVDRNGNFVDLNAKPPGNPALEKDFERVLAEKREN